MITQRQSKKQGEWERRKEDIIPLHNCSRELSLSIFYDEGSGENGGEYSVSTENSGEYKSHDGDGANVNDFHSSEPVNNNLNIEGTWVDKNSLVFSETDVSISSKETSAMT